MKTVDVGAAGVLSDYVRETANGPLIVTDNGTPVAAMVRVDEADVEALELGEQERFMAIVEQGRRQWRAGQSLSAEEARRELGLG